MADPDRNPEDEPPKSKRKVRAEVWNHFTRLPNDKAMCNYCGEEIGCNSKRCGTSPMIGHNARCKMFKDFTEGNTSTVIGSDVSGNMKSIKFDPENFSKSVIEMVVLNELPFSFVESAGFRLFCNNVVPLYKPFSRRTACREIVSLYFTEKAELMRLFRNNHTRVSLTTDIWVAPTTSCNYMVITGHWIDVDWQLQKKILSFRPITNHRGTTIARHMIDCLDQWGIERVFTVTVDNAKGNDRALSAFKEWFRMRGIDSLIQNGDFLHIRCCAHVLNLVVKDGLDKVSNGVAAIRNCVKYVRSSYARLKSFQAKCVQPNVTRGNLTKDCVTRWNSTYSMLLSAITLRSGFERMVSEDKLFCEYFLEEEDRVKRIGLPTTEDWEEVTKLCKFLKIFFDCTNVFSASNTVTSTLAYNEISSIASNLSRRCLSGDMRIKEQAEAMKHKFDKYWDGLLNMNPLVIIASVFDPRNKLRFALLCFEKLYGFDSADYRKIKTVVENTLKLLFNEYKLKLGSTQIPEQIDVAGGSGFSYLVEEDDEEYERMDNIYNQKQRENSHESSATELDIYLLEAPEIISLNPLQQSLKFDVLGWWKHNARKFPVLSEIAKDVLAIQVTSVASESAFSTSGRILDPYRSSLTSFMVEVLVCSQQWLRSRNKQTKASEHALSIIQMFEENEFMDSLDPNLQDA